MICHLLTLSQAHIIQRIREYPNFQIILYTNERYD